jgi:hypothetical protein
VPPGQRWNSPATHAVKSRHEQCDWFHVRRSICKAVLDGATSAAADLLLQCFPQFMKQLCILDCDNSLGGEIRDDFDLFIGEGPDLLATSHSPVQRQQSQRVTFEVSLISG